MKSVQRGRALKTLPMHKAADLLVIENQQECTLYGVKSGLESVPSCTSLRAETGGEEVRVVQNVWLLSGWDFELVCIS